MSTNILVSQAMTTPVQIAFSDSYCMGLVVWSGLQDYQNTGISVTILLYKHISSTLEATFEQSRVRHLSGILGVVGWILACHHDPNCNLTAFTVFKLIAEFEKFKLELADFKMATYVIDIH